MRQRKEIQEVLLAVAASDKALRGFSATTFVGAMRRPEGIASETEPEGMKDADAASSGDFEDRADVGIEVGGPGKSEAVGELAEDNAGPPDLFGPVVGG